MMEGEQLPRPNQLPDKKPPGDFKIVGLNLAIFVVYTSLTMLINGGLIFAGLLMICQVVVCSILALYYRKWSWFLGGLLVLIIGFSTCVGMLSINGL
ncbi:hypothetical protein [Mucilaginibacter sp.]|uniref:hypothetical protein n=1 Tax=Mucilaginibacter sp. TaxID=1882438 RepID=UPI002ED11CF5